MRHGLSEYSRAVMKLAKAEALVNGEEVYDSFRGTLYPDNKHDLIWIKGVMDNFIGQERVGLACLLEHKIDRVKAVVIKLNKKLESM